MLYIIHNDGEEIQIKVGEGQKGKLLPVTSEVLKVQADGFELCAIKSQIKGIPFSIHSVQHWYGDHAKFIIANLKY